MRRFVLAALLLAAIAAPSAVQARAVPTCGVPAGELVVYRHGGAFVTSKTFVKKSARTTNYYGCLRGVGRILLIDRGSWTGATATDGGASVGPQNFVIAGNYLSFVQVGNSAGTLVARMAIEQWNLATGKRTLNPNKVQSVSYATVSAQPKLTASTRGYLAWAITTDFELAPKTVGPALTNLMVFDGHGASVLDSFNSQTDAAPPGTIISGIFSELAITGRVLRYTRLGVPKTATIA